MGEAVESTNEKQRLAKVKVYPGADAMFTLYRDDGVTYDYEKGVSESTVLHWSDASGKLTRSGAALEVVAEPGLVEIVGARR